MSKEVKSHRPAGGEPSQQLQSSTSTEDDGEDDDEVTEDGGVRGNEPGDGTVSSSTGAGDAAVATMASETAPVAAAAVFSRRLSAIIELLCCRLLCVVKLFLVRYRRRQNSHTYNVSDRSCLS